MTTRAKGNDNLPLGVAAIVVTSIALSFGDAVIKLFSADLPIWQLFVLRSALALPILVVIARLVPGFRLAPPRAYGPVALRSALLVANWIAYYAALSQVPISAAVASYYTLPLFIVLLSAIFVGDRIGVVGFIAVGLGVLGMLAIVRPFDANFSTWLLLPLLAAILYAAAMVMTRTHCRDENPAVLAIGINVAFVITGLAVTGLHLFAGPSFPIPILDEPGFLQGNWVAVDMGLGAVLIFLAAVTALATVLTAVAYQSAPGPVIGTLDFTYLLFAVVWGLIIFGERPGVISWIGIVLIIVAGLLAIWRRPTP